MKTKILTILVAVATLMACNSKDVNEPDKPQYVSNHQLEEGEILLKVGVENSSDETSQTNARKIVGYTTGDGSSQTLPFEWQSTDVIRVIANGNKSTFRIYTIDDQTATFYGNMPTGWVDGNAYTVEAGPDQPLPPTGLNGNPIIVPGDDALTSSQMKFVSSATYYHISDDIELSAAWSALRLSLGVDLWWTTTEDKHTTDVGHNFYINTVKILDKDSNALYQYKVDRRGTIQGASGSFASVMMLVVAPGNYDNFKVQFDIDKVKCGDIYSEFNEYYFKKDTYTYPEGLDLDANQYLNAEKMSVHCGVRLKNRTTELTIEQWRAIWPWL